MKNLVKETKNRRRAKRIAGAIMNTAINTSLITAPIVAPYAQVALAGEKYKPFSLILNGTPYTFILSKNGKEVLTIKDPYSKGIEITPEGYGFFIGCRNEHKNLIDTSTTQELYKRACEVIKKYQIEDTIIDKKDISDLENLILKIEIYCTKTGHGLNQIKR